MKNNKLEVLRSDVAIKNNIKSLIDKEIISIKEDIDSLSISKLLKKTANSVEMEDLASNYEITDSVLIGRHDDILPKLPCNFNNELPSDNMIYNASYSNCIKNNKPLENNFVDKLRGNVIAVSMQDSIYCREFDTNDHSFILETGEIPITNTHDQYKKFFLVTDAFNRNKISNCFQNQDLSKGATISFWVKHDIESFRTLNRGLLLFVGDHSKHYFKPEDEKEDKEYAEYTTHLSISSLFDIEYDEAFFNYYKRKSKDFWEANNYNNVSHTVYRNGKSWMHVIISFTNNEINAYVNGIKVEYDTDPIIGKRFNKHETGLSEFKLRTPILDFLSDSNTCLYLCVSIDDTKESDAAYFDDITFFNKSIDNNKEAMDLFTEAMNINLP